MLTFWSQPARNTDIALTLNRVPRCTPFESPESNGMEEAFVKTLKRDHVRISAIPDAATPSVSSTAGWRITTLFPCIPIEPPIIPRIHPFPTRVACPV
jgi:hypothetical protein